MSTIGAMKNQLVAHLNRRFNIWPLSAFALWAVAQIIRLTIQWVELGIYPFSQLADLIGILDLFVPGSLLLLAAVNTTSKPIRFILPTIALIWQALSATIEVAPSYESLDFLIRIAPILSIATAFFAKSVKIADPEAFSAVSPEFRSARSLGRVGLGLLISSPFFALSPAIIALILVPLLCGGGANESNCGPAVLPWFLIATIPAGFVMAIMGSVIMVIGSRRKSLIARANFATPTVDSADNPPADLPEPTAEI